MTDAQPQAQDQAASSRRSFLKRGAAAVAATAVGIGGPTALASLGASEEPRSVPNAQSVPIGPYVAQNTNSPIVVVIIDDWMNYRALDRYLPNWPRTSNLDPWTRSYARENLWFMNAHCASTSCGSSRPPLWWGIAPHESGIYNNQQADDWLTSPVYAGKRSVIGQLKDAGWDTRGFGKVFHSNLIEKHDPGCWTEFTPHVWLNKEQAEVGGEYSDYRSNSLLSFGSLNSGPELMPDHEVVNAAIRFIKGMGDGDAAFVGIKKPHVPLRVPTRFFDAIDPSEIVLPEWNSIRVTGEARDFLQAAQHADMKGIRDSGEWRLLVHSYLAAVKYADYEFGRVIRSVPANARVILTSDHGFALGERGALTKKTVWDQSTAVPLVIGGTGLNYRVDTAVSLLDVPSTIQDFAGLPVQKESLMSIATRPMDTSRAVVTTYRTPNWAGSRIASSVRQGDYQLIVYQDGTEELYDVKDDPEELVNLADDFWNREQRNLLYQSIPTSYV